MRTQVCPFAVMVLVALVLASCEPITVRSRVVAYIVANDGRPTALESSIPAADATVGVTDYQTLTLTFNHELFGAANAANWELSGSAMAGVTIAGVAAQSEAKTWKVTTQGNASSGRAVLQWKGLTDGVDKTVEGSLSFTVDARVPGAPEQVTVSPLGGLTDALKVSYVVDNFQQDDSVQVTYTPKIPGRAQPIVQYYPQTSVELQNLPKLTTFTFQLASIGSPIGNTTGNKSVVVTQTGSTQPSVGSPYTASNDPVGLLAQDGNGNLFYVSTNAGSGSNLNQLPTYSWSASESPAAFYQALAVDSAGTSVYTVNQNQILTRWSFDSNQPPGTGPGAAYEMVAASGWPFDLKGPRAGVTIAAALTAPDGKLYLGDTHAGGGNLLRLDAYPAPPVVHPLRTINDQVRPSALAWESAGKLIVGDGWAHKIYRLDVTTDDGTLVAIPNTPADLIPSGVAVSSTGTVYITDKTAQKVYSIGLDGSNLQTLLGPGAADPAQVGLLSAHVSSPFGVQVDAADNVTFADGYRIRKITY